MPPRKRNEEQLGKMGRSYNFYLHKWRDRGYMSCPNCHRPLTKCPICHQDMLLPKAQTKPDYLMAMSYVYVEAKGAGDSWAFTTSIRENQRVVAEEHETWLFLEIGKGRAPKGKNAFLVPWEKWEAIEKELLENNQKSLIFEASNRSRMPVASEVLGEWQLEWQKQWTIPSQHEFWKRHGEIFLLEGMKNYGKSTIES